MTRRIPRLEVIEAFIEAARAPSFRIAAQRCALSPAAFSRRIQAFHAFVGRDIFDRQPGGMRLTQAGQECLDTLEPMYRNITQAALELSGRRASEKVTLSLSHSLAMSWLIPRLERFRESWPDIEVSIQTTRTAEAIRSGEADLGVCASDVDALGLHTQHLLDVHVAPVASPDLAAAFREGRIDLGSQRLLAPVQAPGMWSWWSEATGANGLPLKATDTFDMAYALYEAAAAGWGVASGMGVTVASHLKTGRLVSLGLPSARYPGGYRLVGRASRIRAPAVAAMWRWLAEEASSGQRATGLA
ncbi:MAG: LysR family transcriptional regulator, partial [Alphaproteobacteria bacterium]|nr:LysR family transcriptional regulator [Alphaproteobacteria bacterium]